MASGEIECIYLKQTNWYSSTLTPSKKKRDERKIVPRCGGHSLGLKLKERINELELSEVLENDWKGVCSQLNGESLEILISLISLALILCEYRVLSILFEASFSLRRFFNVIWNLFFRSVWIVTQMFALSWKIQKTCLVRPVNWIGIVSLMCCSLESFIIVELWKQMTSCQMTSR